MMKSLSQTINFSPRNLAASVTLGVLICLAASNTVFADSVTYKQIRHSQSETSSAQNQDPQKPAEKPQEPKALESPTHPEFVRLPDGRIVKYGPGIICEDECREPITPKVSRRTRAAGPFWFILPPFAAGALVCAILCGSGLDGLQVGGLVREDRADAGAAIGEGNSQFTYTWSSSPAGVTFTNNPNTTSGNNSSTVATFPSNGTYQITCFVQEGGGLRATSAATTVTVTAPVPANIWATSSNGTQISGFAVSNGTYISGPNNIFAASFPGTTTGGTSTAALGRSSFPTAAPGHFYWLPNTTGNDGLVEVFAATSTGASATLVGSVDFNVLSGTDLGFVRTWYGP